MFVGDCVKVISNGYIEDLSPMIISVLWLMVKSVGSLFKFHKEDFETVKHPKLS